MGGNWWADFWRNDIGVNVIPADSVKKKPLVEWTNDSKGDWQVEPISQEIHDEWKSNGMFEKGLAIICGQVFHNNEHLNKWLNGIDSDNRLGTEKICPGGVKQAAVITLVEQHDDKEKVHIYFYTERPIQSKVANDGKGGKVPQLEIKSGGKFLLYCAGGNHKDGSAIEIVGANCVKTVDAEALETRIDGICKEYGIPYLVNGNATSGKSIQEISKKGFVVHEGENRSLHILRYLDSKKAYNSDFGEEVMFALAMQFNNEHCDPPYPKKKIWELVIQSKTWIESQQGEGKIVVRSNENLKLDEYVIAKRLRELYNFKTLEKTKEILFWRAGKYREGGEEIISKRSRRIALGVRQVHIAEIKAIIRDETGYLSRDEFDKESYIVNMKNITFNLKTGEKEEYSPDYLSRVQVPIFYDPKAMCPRFNKFLSTSLDGDRRKIRIIWEMIALCFIKDNNLIEKGFMHTGMGSNGKSILFGIIIAMLGLENISSKTIQSLEKNRFALSGLEGKLANICPEVGGTKISSTEKIKGVISGDPLEGEKKGKDPYPFIPFATLIFSANEIPEVSDGSDGFARKFELIRWEKQFYGKDRDNSVKTIKNSPSELSGIFNKLVPIAKELLQTQKLKYESTVADVRLQWLAQSDSVQRFLDNNTKRKPDGACSIANVSANYHTFCKDKGLTPVSSAQFNKKMEKNGFARSQKRINGNPIKVWLGFELCDKPDTKQTTFGDEDDV